MMAWDEIQWMEGMILSAKHFDLLSDLQKLHIHKSLDLQTCFWGFDTLLIDTSNLNEGYFTLKKAEGRFKNGQGFIIDEPIIYHINPEKNQDLYLSLHEKKDWKSIEISNIPCRRPTCKITNKGKVTDLKIVTIKKTKDGTFLANIESKPILLNILSDQKWVEHLKQLIHIDGLTENIELTKYTQIKARIQTLLSLSYAHPIQLYENLIFGIMLFDATRFIPTYNHEKSQVTLMNLYHLLISMIKKHISKIEKMTYRQVKENVYQVDQKIKENTTYLISINNHFISDKSIVVDSSINISSTLHHALSGLKLTSYIVNKDKSLPKRLQWLQIEIPNDIENISISPQQKCDMQDIEIWSMPTC